MEKDYIQQAQCKICEKSFSFSKHQQGGLFCSNKCSQISRRNILSEKFWAGEIVITRKTARNFLAEKRGYKCEICGIAEWQGKKLTLHVDHINGDPGNSHHSNLRLLCPNCHSQTPFLGAANKGRGRGSQGLKSY